MAVTMNELLDRETTARPLRRVEYDQLVEAGAFDDERIELIEGRLVEMSPQGSRHGYVIQKLNMALVRAVGDRAEVRVQCPLALSELSEPEPDFVVVPTETDVLSDHPFPADVLLVVEVAVSSLAYDRRLKAALYAQAGLGEYWVIDANHSVVHVHRAPHGDVYTEVAECGGDDLLVPRAIPGRPELRADSFLPGEEA